MDPVDGFNNDAVCHAILSTLGGGERSRMTVINVGSLDAGDSSSREAELRRRIAELEAALRPFAAACFNDNGGVTISTGHIHTGDWMRAKRVIREGE